MNEPCPKVGECIVYHDENNVMHNALVTIAWGTNSNPCVNLRHVSDNEKMTDQYGRQTIAVSSVSHKSQNAAPGRYWRRECEEPNPAHKPSAT